ncbi:MAG TPA: hypothetical protein VGM54_21045 [Chthoniobacter sp.]|jgi:tetratricopeptide (TPR) repeat protein
MPFIRSLFRSRADVVSMLYYLATILCFFAAYHYFGANVTLSLILAYAGVMFGLVIGSQAWIQRIYQAADLDAGGREQNKNAVLVAVNYLGAIVTGLLVVCLASVTTFKSGPATPLLWSLGALLVGSVIGFLFSLPKIGEATEKPTAANAGATAASTAKSSAAATPAGTPPAATPPPTASATASAKPAAKSGFQVNTSLNEIADWLTKIIVGVSLVNAQTAYHHFVIAAKHLGAGLGAEHPGDGDAFAAGLIVTFFCLGLLGTYLLTRLWVSAALVQADQTSFGAFTGAGVDEQDLQILEDETHGFSETRRDMDLSAAAYSVATRIAQMDSTYLRTWRELGAWAKAKAALGEYQEAIDGYERAVQLYPENSRLRLDFAVALFLAANAAAAQDQKLSDDLRTRERNQILEAYHRLNALTPAEVRKNIYLSLTHCWLYLPAPGGFTKAIAFALEYVRNPRWLPSGGIWVNLACAYGQNAAWLLAAGTQVTPDIRAGLIEAIKEALRIDDNWKLRFQISLQHDHPDKTADPREFRAEDDLETYEYDPEIRALIGLPPARLPDPPANVKLTQTSPTTLKITWTASPRATQYQPFKKVQNVDPAPVGLPPVTTTETTLENLPAQATISVQILATNPTGPSPLSPEVQITLT